MVVLCRLIVWCCVVGRALAGAPGYHSEVSGSGQDTTALLQSKVQLQQDKSSTTINSTQKSEHGSMPAGEETVYTVMYFGRRYNISQNPDLELKTVFDDIAERNTWLSEETVSGEGSTLATTAPVRECLGRWIEKYNISLFVDIPCGDANWQGHIPGLEHIKYRGYDIARLPVETARRKNADRKHMSFDHIDLTSEVPPERPDIIMLRDVIQHLPLQKGKQMLLNAKRSGARFLAVSTFSDGSNTEVPAGAVYQNNVHAEPFNLPKLIESCANYVDYWPTDHLELINLSDWNPSD